jgi:hypothetical protein
MIVVTAVIGLAILVAVALTGIFLLGRRAEAPGPAAPAVEPLPALAPPPVAPAAAPAR